MLRVDTSQSILLPHPQYSAQAFESIEAAQTYIAALEIYHEHHFRGAHGYSVPTYVKKSIKKEGTKPSIARKGSAADGTTATR